MTISENDIRKMRIKAGGNMHSPMGQDVRIEWFIKSGGTPNVTYDIVEGGTDTLNIFDTKAIISSIDDKQLVALGLTLMDGNHALIQLDTNINLQMKPNFVIVQKIDTEYWEGDGTGASSVWTPDVAPNWTVNQWKGFWLWFSDKRFLIVSNTTTALTVTLGNHTLPTSSTSGEIVAAKVWKPVHDTPSLADNMRTPIGSDILFQTILCTDTGTIGDQNA